MEGSRSKLELLEGDDWHWHRARQQATAWKGRDCQLRDKYHRTPRQATNEQPQPKQLGPEDATLTPKRRQRGNIELQKGR